MTSSLKTNWKHQNPTGGNKAVIKALINYYEGNKKEEISYDFIKKFYKLYMLKFIICHT